LPLSQLSNVIKNIKAIKQKRIYVPFNEQKKAIEILRKEGLYDGE